MRTASAGMVSLLATRQFFIADLYSFTLIDGTVLEYTSFDQDIGSFSSGLGWERTKWKLSTGLSVDTMEVTLHARPDQTVAGIPIIEHIAGGFWDGARCTIERAMMATPGDTAAGTITIMSNGWIGDIAEIGRISCTMQIVSKLALLDVAMPKGLFQPSCRWVFGSPSCGVNRAALVQVGAAGAGSTQQVIETGLTETGPIAAPVSGPTLSPHTVPGTNLPPNITYYAQVTYLTTLGETTASPETSLLIAATDAVLRVTSPPSGTSITGYNVYVGVSPGDEQLQSTSPVSIGSTFDTAALGILQSGTRPPASSSNGFFSLGTLTMTSGDAAGTTRVVEGNTGTGTTVVRVPFFSAVTIGDSLEIVPGCEHTIQACTRFANLINFGGEPFIPIPEVGSA